MKRFFSFICFAIRESRSRKFISKLISDELIVINELAREIAGHTGKLVKLGDLMNRNTIIRKTIIFVAMNKKTSNPNKWTKQELQDWLNYVKPEVGEKEEEYKALVEFWDSPFLKIEEYKEKASQKGIGDTYIFTYKEYTKAKYVTGLYKLFENLRGSISLCLYPNNSFFHEADWEEQKMVLNVLEKTETELRGVIKALDTFVKEVKK